MTTKDIRTITIEDFKRDLHLIDYVDENLIILDNVNSSFPKQIPVRLECCIMVFCLEEAVEIHINEKAHVLKANHCAILLPNTIIQHVSNSGTCNLRIVALTTNFIEKITTLKKEVWEIAFYLYRNPILPVNKDNSYKLYLYKELMITCFSDQDYPFSKEAKRHLFAAIFCEFLAILYKDIPLPKASGSRPNDRSAYIFRKFMEAVAEDDGSHRNVAYYADKLCYSPKHLSTVIKKISGKGPLTIINNHAMECIKYQLKNSDLSMKEIADRFDFVNPSFFGKFVKSHLGISPLQYRIQESIKETSNT